MSKTAFRKFSIRLANQSDAPAISAVHAICWHQAYGNLLPEEMLASATAARRLPARYRVLADPSVTCFVAVSKTKVAGFADCGPYRGAEQDGRGEVYAIYVLEAFHGRRVGLRLLSCCATALLAQGCKSMRLWSLEANARARKFYDSAGGQVLERRETARGSMVLAEVEYQWDLAGMEWLAGVALRHRFR